MRTREYDPDRWVLVKIAGADKSYHYRIAAGWGGSFTSGSSWKLSSGMKDGATEDDSQFVLPQSSGSTYICRKDSYGMTGHLAAVLSSYKEEADNSNGELSFEVIAEENTYDILRSFTSKRQAVN